MKNSIDRDRLLRTVPNHERHFYATDKAFGRFGMRVFEPTPMEAPHWHGHIEFNYITNGYMEYDLDNRRLVIPQNRLVVFWAGVPHQLTKIVPQSDKPVQLANLYMPVDAFLLLTHIGKVQVALLGGGLLALPEGFTDLSMIDRWYNDYRTNRFEQLELIKMELNLLLRRAQAEPLEFLNDPITESERGRMPSSNQTLVVVEMIRFILENLSSPITNANVAEVVGLHQNYALSLFSQIMRMPMKRFVIRLRLLRARALLIESTMAISLVAEESGFASISQFYDHFKRAYGQSPKQVRENHLDAKSTR